MGRRTRDAARDAKTTGAARWHESHRVALERIPPGVELSTAEAISFIGRGVRVLTHPTKSASMRGNFDAEAYAARSTRRVRALAAAPAFDPRAFEAEVEVMRAEIAEALGEVLLRESGLVSHLAAMRDFYLLGKGDLYATFLDEARDLLALPPKPGSATRSCRRTSRRRWRSRIPTKANRSRVSVWCTRPRSRDPGERRRRPLRRRARLCLARTFRIRRVGRNRTRMRD